MQVVASGVHVAQPEVHFVHELPVFAYPAMHVVHMLSLSLFYSWKDKPQDYHFHPACSHQQALDKYCLNPVQLSTPSLPGAGWWSSSPVHLEETVCALIAYTPLTTL